MSHLCLIDADLLLAPGISREQLEAVLAPFLEMQEMTFADAEEDNSLALVNDPPAIELAIEYHGQGGFDDAFAKSMRDALSPLVQGAQWFVLIDINSGDSREVRVPYFFGNETERLQAQVLYGLQEMSEWVAPVLGKDSCESVKALLMQKIGSVETSVQLKHWDAYHDADAPLTHELVLDDRRKQSGQLFMDLKQLNGGYDDVLSVTMEVQSNPFLRSESRPCAVIHLNSDQVAMSLHKIGDKIVARPETGVSIEPFTTILNGVSETLWLISGPDHS